MPVDRQDLEARIAAARSDDTVRGLVFNALFSVVREVAGEEAARACDPTGKASRVEFFSYPVTDFLALAAAVAERIGGRLGGEQQAFFRIGHRAGGMVLDSMVGKTMLALSEAGGARQLLANVPSAYKGAVSYGERRLEWTGERRARVTFRRELLAPPFHCGVFTAVLERVGAKDIRTEARQTGALDAECELAWEAA
ncbi:DUF2378 family protein [Anaeromyxobacter sp. PSR-1]|uniref:DUF2378 family protein n=1 Tax=unclassified Anaeromyxobacter TaxID=2620896 RepID=UPI0005DFDB3E|nr:DUF2378 family protein [Anaeromyxobacter sp. PSR-1]GAO04164.1 hypothetical protein PSR1_03053 [Anaeromyxobacter sp. PSR-1]